MQLVHQELRAQYAEARIAEVGWQARDAMEDLSEQLAETEFQRHGRDQRER